MIYPFSKRPDSGGFSDEELQIAARAVQDAMLRSLEEESESKHIFSESFLARMNALFRKDERRNGIKRVLQHAAIIVIGVFLAGVLLLAFNPEVRADFTRWVRNTYEKSFFYQFFSSEDSVVPDEASNSLPDVEFGWLPGEYDNKRILSDEDHVIVLLNDSKDSIMLEYWSIASVKYVEFFTEDYYQEIASVSGHPADYYRAMDDNTASILIWINEDAGIVYYLSSYQPKENMITIAENIKNIV